MPWRRERRRAKAYRDALTLLYWRPPLHGATSAGRSFPTDVLAGAELENLEVHRIVAAALQEGDRCR